MQDATGKQGMISDFRAPTCADAIEADLCIIGGGAAGVTIAADLAGSALEVVLLESGREAWDERT